MYIKVGVIRRLIIEAIHDNVDDIHRTFDSIIEEGASLPEQWYHGSPWKNMGDISSYQGRIMFLTDSLEVAKEYKQPLLDTGRRPKGDVEQRPVVYTVKLKFSDDQIFDTRQNEHLDLFYQLVHAAHEKDANMPRLRRSDLTRVYAARGSNIGGMFPSYGCVSYLLRQLSQQGFVASIIAEGTQGASLAVLNPQSNLDIIYSEEV